MRTFPRVLARMMARLGSGHVSKVFQTGVAVALAAALPACGSKQKGPSAPPVVTVKVTTVTAQPVGLTTELPGRTVPYRVAEIRPQVSGVILKRMFIEGSDVREGQQL